MTILRVSFAAVLTCLLVAVGPVVGQPVPATPQVDVQVSGNSAPAIVFIPGLATPGVIWNDTVARFQTGHACHVVTLAGFGGKPPVKTEHFLQDAADQIITYVRAQKLEKPILVGHSLGGVLAMEIALKAPDLPGRLVIVDSLPFFAGTMAPGVESAADATPLADNYRRLLAAQSPEQFAASQKQFLATMVTAPEAVAKVAALTGKSDPATTGQAMAELLTDDLRPRLAGIKCPVLVLASLVVGMDMGYPREMAAGLYRKQYAGLPQVQFEFFEHARHFIMVDDPARFDAVLEKEIAAH